VAADWIKLSPFPSAKNPEPMSEPKNDFAAESRQPRPVFFYELLRFLSQNKKWWLLPIILITLLLGLLMILGSSTAAPFIYTLF
jgi:Family of unknown function (DUF5989)